MEDKKKTGFTVLEILVAMTIFSMVTLVVFSVFSAAIRSQRPAKRETNMLARSRFAMDSIERDLTNVFFRDETSYNQNIRRQIEAMEAQRADAEYTNDWDNFYSQYGNPADDEEEGQVGNPYDKGRIIDLQFTGEKDSLTFTVQKKFEVGSPYRPFGLAKVKYFVEKGNLIRRDDSLEPAPRNIFGESLAKKTPPSYTVVAEEVQSFQVRYVYWFDNQWYEVETWSSSNRTIRNAHFLMGDYEHRRSEYDDNSTPQFDANGNRISGGANQSLRPGDPGWNEYLNDQESEPLDRLPAEIRIRLVIGPKDNKKRQVPFQRLIRIFPAEETYTPWNELSEDEREEEQFMRDGSFQLIFPGVLEE